MRERRYGEREDTESVRERRYRECEREKIYREGGERRYVEKE